MAGMSGYASSGFFFLLIRKEKKQSKIGKTA